jgi:carbamoyltransferase
MYWRMRAGYRKSQPRNDSMLLAHEVIFGTQALRLRGRGACIALLDSGIGEPIGLGTRLTNEMSMQDAPPRSLRGDSHALRVASICAEGDEIDDGAGGALGIAPEACIVSALYEPLVPFGIADWVRKPRAIAPHILGLPWSAAEPLLLAHAGRSAIASLTESVLVVAAAGHDGPGKLRFPGTCTEALTVGICDQQGRRVNACGAEEADRKPELLVHAGPYAARLEDGSLGSIGGTSAAVGIVSGLAALWVERLRDLGIEPRPWILRAVLLAGSRPGPSAHRVASADGLGDGSSNALELTASASGVVRLRVRVAAAGCYRFAFVAAYLPPSGRWLTPECPVRLRCGEASTQADGWCIFEVELKPGREYILEAEASGRPQHLALAVVGPGSASVEVDRVRLVRRRPLVVVGLSASHDASACVMVDGRVEAAIQLERITRVKHDGVGYLCDEQAASYVLEAAGLRPTDVDAFAFNAQPLMPGWVGLGQPCPADGFRLFDPFSKSSFFVSHHLCHGYSALYGCNFEQATVLVADGSGGSVHEADDCVLDGPALREYLASGERGQAPAPAALHVISTYAFGGHGLRLVNREFGSSFNVRIGSSSLGEAYAAVSQYIFGNWQDSGKLMGLAPYGKAGPAEDTFLVEGPDGLLNFGSAWKNRFRQASGPREPLKHRDLAARVQRDLEEALLQRARLAIRATGFKNVAYAGGLALNCVANERIARETDATALFVFPASHDAGISIGAAAALHHRLTGSVARCSGTYSDALGRVYGRRDFRWALQRHADLLKIEPLNIADLAQRLASGKLVGWFQGGSEFGPRALGHRSILADPRDAATWQRINSEVKYREDFRPFAPMVPVERASEFFELDSAAPFMTRTVPVRPWQREKLGAVTHVNGSARVQTVAAAEEPLVHALLVAFGELTGVPVLLNTSLNVRGQPLVETPLQALELLLATHLDLLVLGDQVARLRTPARRAVQLHDCLSLAPSARVVSIASAGGTSARIECSLRAGVAYELQPWCAGVLAALDGRQPIEALLSTWLPDGTDESAVLDLFTALRMERLLV